MVDVKLPDIGEGIHEGELVKWLVNEGDSVAEFQPLVEVMTDKATVEIPSPAAGRVVKLNAKAGENVKVGGTLLVLESAGGEAKASPAPSAPSAPPSRPAAPPPAAPVRVPPPAPAPVSPVPALPATSVSASSALILAAPATRRLAREMGVDLGALQGTGPNGRITPEDVRRASLGRAGGAGAIPSPAAPAAGRPAAVSAVPVAAAWTGPDERVPLKGIRKKIAEHMVLAKRTIPHFSYVDEADVTELVSLRQEAKTMAEKRGIALSYIPFVLKAIALALREFPTLNAVMDETRQELVIRKTCNIGVSVDTPAGLIVPVLKGCERRGLLEIAGELNRLVEAARSGRIAIDDLQGGTFTLTTTGSIGGLFAMPIINHPETAIFAFNKIHRRPVAHEGAVAVRDMVYLSMSLDHRVADGALAARFMNAVIGYLTNPQRLLMEMLMA